MALPIVGAAAVAFLLNIALPPRKTVVELVGLIIAYPVGVALALLVGYWLGRHAWPWMGRRLARGMLRRAIHGRRRPILFLTHRPDYEPTLLRRVLEVLGFAIGVSIIVPAVLQVLGTPPGLVQTVGGILTLLALLGAFVLVPYWTYGRLGIRRVDSVRWVVEPLSLGYAERLKLSNGALLLIAAGAAVNLAFRAGASGDQALIEGVVTVVRLAASNLIVATAAVVYYSRVEKQVVRHVEEIALAEGVRDGRRMSDGEFLPALAAA